MMKPSDKLVQILFHEIYQRDRSFETSSFLERLEFGVWNHKRSAISLNRIVYWSNKKNYLQVIKYLSTAFIGDDENQKDVGDGKK